ncbi:uncharacterized protein A1O9_00800 [Exophiala aquamarina CBS 119918]|uniref:tRNA (guanine(9)-N1)-methyltransferase n=1 Tax=Exophiala aquamarina CBS 119918 TaxID=1182545 RepID=A0A072PSX4_9EURO|nr:uncharacterized protein A1O9_00800 [Exophiala aquamarina CBS 119918]KEF62827.1 hypothetical protein A1O9_00800 [Exophiala aquamarina CBS 119918]
MATEERPNKLRRLEKPENEVPEDEATTPLLRQPCENVASESENSKPYEHTANDVDGTGAGPEGDLDVQNPPGSQIEAKTAPPQNGEHAQPMSKSQLKKLRKQQEWEAGRDYRKAKRKQKTQEKRQRKREAREEAEAQQQQQTSASKTPPTNHHRPRPRPVVLPVTIMIDCGFDDLMTEKERISLGSQLTRSYSDNWHAPFQTHLFLSSWGGLLRERFDTVLRKHYLNWKGITFETGDFVQAAQKANEVMRGSNGGKLLGIFQPAVAPSNDPRPQEMEQIDIKQPQSSTNGASPPSNTQHDTAPSFNRPSTTAAVSVDSAQHQPVPPPQSEVSFASQACPDDGEIIYLTSDSPNTLSTLRPYSTYIVGGLVDKNRHKGICYRTACDRGVQTAKLPIGEYLEMQSRKVLTTNHVVEIMIRYLECGNWGEAFLKVIPKRKGGRLREEKKEGDDGIDDEGEEEEDDGGVEEEDRDHGEVVDDDYPNPNGQGGEIGTGEHAESSYTSHAEVPATAQ